MSAYSALALLRQLVITKKPEMSIGNSIKSYALCKIFYRLGYLSKYKCIGNKICISLRYHNNLPVLKDMVIYSRPSNRRTICYRALKNQVRIEYTNYLLSTDYGIVNTAIALRLKTGGEILCKFI